MNSYVKYLITSLERQEQGIQFKITEGFFL